MPTNSEGGLGSTAEECRFLEPLEELAEKSAVFGILAVGYPEIRKQKSKLLKKTETAVRFKN